MYGFFRKKKQRNLQKPPEIVDITNPTWQSIQGKYFIAQTDELTLGGSNHAWGGLFNPEDSGVNLLFDIFTITNFSTQSYLAEIWLSSNLPGKAIPSTFVHPSNLTISPPPQPKIKVNYASLVNGLPTGGVNAFDRIVPANSTLISDSSKGSIILPPGGSFAIFLTSPGSLKYQSRMALTWWEEPIER